MSHAQIEQAIAALSSEERRDLIRSLVPRKLVLTPQEAERIRQGIGSAKAFRFGLLGLAPVAS